MPNFINTYKGRHKLVSLLIPMLLILILIASSISFPSKGDSPSPLYERKLQADPSKTQEIINLYYQGDFQTCFEKGKEYIWSYPDDATIMVFTISAASQLDQISDLAKETEDKLFNDEVNPQIAHTLLGFISLMEYTSTGQEEYLRDAKEEFLEAISGSEKYASSFTGLGMTYYMNKLHLKALWNLERSYKINPYDPLTVEYLAKTYRKLGNSDKALKVLRKLNQKIQYPDAFFLTGLILFERGIYEEAFENFMRCQELDEKNINLKVTCLVRASDSANMLHNKSQAIELLEKALRIDPKNPWVRYKLKKLRGEDEKESAKR